MRALILAAALALLFSPFALSEDDLLDAAGLAGLERAADALGVDGLRDIAGKVLSGEALYDAGDLRGMAERLLSSVRDALLTALRAIAAPVLATLLLRLALGRSDGPLTLLCRLGCALSLATLCADGLDTARRLMERLCGVSDALSPALAAALTLTGESALAAALSPASALCSGLIESALRDIGLPMCAVAATVCIAGSLSGRFRLDRLLSLIRRFTTWGAGLMTAGFAALLGVEGHLAAAQDGATVRAVRGMLRGTIPFVGGSLSDSAGALVQSAALARSAVGMAGMALAALPCALPMTWLLAHALSLKLAAAIVQPVADPGIVRIAAGFGDVAGMLLAICGAGAVLNALLCGTCLGLFGGI